MGLGVCQGPEVTALPNCGRDSEGPELLRGKLPFCSSFCYRLTAVNIDYVRDFHAQEAN